MPIPYDNCVGMRLGPNFKSTYHGVLVYNVKVLVGAFSVIVIVKSSKVSCKLYTIEEK